MNQERKEFPLPQAQNKKFNFPNGAGLTYEAKHVRECLRKGKDTEDGGQAWPGLGIKDSLPHPPIAQAAVKNYISQDPHGMHLPAPSITVPWGIMGIVVLLAAVK